MKNLNPSEWKVTYNPMAGYAVYRLRDKSAVDHSGNREMATAYMDSCKEAQAIADRLNEEGR